MSDLFPEAKQDSPKLAWLKKNRLQTDLYFGVWRCSDYGRVNEVRDFDTEDEAILEYCAKYGLKHWTLE